MADLISFLNPVRPAEQDDNGWDTAGRIALGLGYGAGAASLGMGARDIIRNQITGGRFLNSWEQEARRQNARQQLGELANILEFQKTGLLPEQRILPSALNDVFRPPLIGPPETINFGGGPTRKSVKAASKIASAPNYTKNLEYHKGVLEELGGITKPVRPQSRAKAIVEAYKLALSEYEQQLAKRNASIEWLHKNAIPEEMYRVISSIGKIRADTKAAKEAKPQPQPPIPPSEQKLLGNKRAAAKEAMNKGKTGFTYLDTLLALKEGEFPQYPTTPNEYKPTAKNLGSAQVDLPDLESPRAGLPQTKFGQRNLAGQLLHEAQRAAKPASKAMEAVSTFGRKLSKAGKYVTIGGIAAGLGGEVAGNILANREAAAKAKPKPNSAATPPAAAQQPPPRQRLSGKKATEVALNYLKKNGIRSDNLGSFNRDAIAKGLIKEGLDLEQANFVLGKIGLGSIPNQKANKK